MCMLLLKYLNDVEFKYRTVEWPLVIIGRKLLLILKRSVETAISKINLSFHDLSQRKLFSHLIDVVLNI